MYTEAIYRIIIRESKNVKCIVAANTNHDLNEIVPLKNVNHLA